MAKINRTSVTRWLDSNEEIAKEIISSFLQRHPLLCKEIIEEQSPAQGVSTRRFTMHRLSVVGGPPPLLSVLPDDNATPLSTGGMKRFTSSPMVSPRISTEQLKKLNKQDLFMELLKDVLSPDFDINSLSHKILVNVLILINADRSSLFLVEGTKDNPILVSRLFDVTEHSSLDSVLHDDSESIKIPFGVGIIGQVAMTGDVINIRDAYENPHFNTQVDQLTGYRTKSLLCMPIKTSSGEVIGVAQVINKKDSEEFTEEDVEVFSTYMTFCAIGLINAQLFEQSFTHSQRLQILLELTRKLFEDNTSLEEMIKCIMSEALKLIPCEKCVVLVVDSKTDNNVEFKMAIQFNGKETETMTSVDSSRIEGFDVVLKVARTCETIINDEKYNSMSVSPVVSSSPVPLSSSLLCMPVFNDKGDLMAVVKMDNKLNGLPFNDAEHESFQVFSMFCGLAIHNVLNYEQIMLANAKQSVALEVLSYHAAASLTETESFLSMELPSVTDIELISYSFDDTTLSDDYTILASVLMFKEMGFIERFHIDEKSLFRWALTVRKNYRPVLYHNWRHAFNVAQTMFTILMSGKIGTQFTDIEKLSLLIACFSHDLDHRGTNNAFQSKIDSPLALLYTTSTMEHHHFNHCVMILNTENNKLLEGLSSDTYSKVIRIIETAILSTDLALYFKQRDVFFNIVKTDAFDSSNTGHRDILRGMLMTACDVAAVSKPWTIQRRVADLVTMEFFEQGDRERNDLKIIPVAMMDRQKKDQLPQMQADFIKNVCLPLYETLDRYSSELSPLAAGAQRNLNNWQKLVNSPKTARRTSSLVTRPQTSTTPSTTVTTTTVVNGNRPLISESEDHGFIEAWTSDNRINRRRHGNKKCIIS